MIHYAGASARASLFYSLPVEDVIYLTAGAVSQRTSVRFIPFREVEAYSDGAI